MADNDNRELARRFFEDLCTKRQNDLASVLLAPDVVLHDPQIPNVRGLQAAVETFAVYQEGFDGVWTIEEIILGEHDRVTVRWTGSGTHKAEVMGIPPTGKSVRVDAISVLRIADGKIAEMWEVWDTLGMLQQLGVVPTPGG